MDDEFLDDEFYMKLLRMGSKHPHIRDSIRDVLDEIEKHKEDDDEEPE